MDRFKGDKEVTETTIGGVEMETARNGAPVLKDSLGYLELKLVQTVDAGDHTLFIGEVTTSKLLTGGEALSIAHLDGHCYGG